MSTIAGNSLNLNKNELQNAVIQNLGAAPSSPAIGQIYTDTSSSSNTNLAAYLNVSGSGTWVNLNTGFTNPMTTLGDTIYGGGSGSATRLAGNTTSTRQFFSQTGTGAVSAAPIWASLDAADIQTGILGVARGGTGIGTLTTGNYINAASSSSFQQRTPTQVRTDIGAVNIAGDTMTGALILNADPVTALGAATKQYVDSTTQGLDFKQPARVATTGSNITLAGGAPNTLDGVSLALNDRILVKDQTTASQNGIYCADEDTEILTKDGYKKYNEVKAGDIVLTLNMNTGKSEWEPVKAVHIFPKEERTLLSIETGTHSSLTTLNHRWPVKKDIYTDGRKVIDGQRIKIQSNIKLGEKIVIKHSEKLSDFDLLIRAAECSTLPKYKKYSDDFVKIMAWFYTEGHIRKDRGKISGLVRITQSHKVNAHKVAEIRNALSGYFGNSIHKLSGGKGSPNPEWRETKRNTGMTVFSLNTSAGKQLINQTVKNTNKGIKKSFITSLTKEQLELFVQTSIDADGSRIQCNGYIQLSFTQKDKACLDAFLLACHLLGKATTVHSVKDYYTVNLVTSTYTYSRNRKEVIYSGHVWCPETNNSTWYARRNNTYYFTGNTVTTLGSGANGTWTRATDADTSAKVTCGLYLYIDEGSTWASSAWVLSTANPITLGTTSLTFVRFNALGQVTAGTGLTKSGDTISIANIITAGGPTGNATTVPVITWNAQGQLTAVTTTTISGVSPVGSSLTSGNIWVGNGSNLAAAVVMSGDVTISNTGATTLTSNIPRAQTITLTNATTNAADAVLTLSHDSSGTPSAGFGSIVQIELQDSTTADTLAANLTTTWVTATHASRAARSIFNVYDTVAREIWRGEASGSAAKIGFLGAAAALQQTGDIGTALVTFGLMSGTPTFAGANITGVVSLATNLNGGTTGQIPYQSAANTTLFTGPGSSGQVLQSNGTAAPTYSTATYPSVATSSGTILRANGTNWIASTATFADTYTASNLLYSNGTNTVTGLATANSGVLVTSGSGVPSISSIFPAGIQRNTTNSISAAGSTQGTATALTSDINIVTTVGSGQGVILPASVAGKIIRVSNRGANALLIYPPTSSAIDALGTNVGYSLPINAWVELDCASSTQWYSSAVGAVANATNISGGTAGQVVYQSAPSTTGFIGPGSTGQVLQSNGTSTPTYSTATYPSTAASSGTILRANGTNWITSTSTFSDTYSASNILYSNGANTVTGLATANNGVLVTNGSGVPSISSILPAGIQVATSTGISAAGSTQGTATALTNDINNVTTVGSGQGVVLPASVAGKQITVINNGANALAVYPPVSSAIDTLGTNAAYSIIVSGRAVFKCISSTQWYSDSTVLELGYTPAKKYTTTFTGAGPSYTITHNLGTTAVLVQVYNDSSNLIIVDTAITSSNVVTLTYGNGAPTAVNHTAVVIG